MAGRSKISGSFSVLLAVIFFFSGTGCGKKSNTDSDSPSLAVSSNRSLEEAVPQGKYTFDEVLARSVQEEKFFSSLCRLLLTRSVLFALDNPAAAEASAGSKGKISIKIMKRDDSTGPGIAMLFSSKAALAAAGEKFEWQKNTKGMYSFAAMNGKAAFQVLQANGYRGVVLDAASPNAFTFSEAQMAVLASGQIPLFYDAA
ncbi:MAG: SseB family protein [Candidatus Omnitrophica bacterium]|nr:SseB family protein [Candidatus Omnitrophota bacterium]